MREHFGIPSNTGCKNVVQSPNACYNDFIDQATKSNAGNEIQVE
ncbi:hypothetical protein [Acinetobacter sp.]